MKAYSRFADSAEISSKEFLDIISRLNEISQRYSLADHSGYNRNRFPWSEKYLKMPQIYASRLWEYPWAALSAELVHGMACADIGCGESAFTVLLKEYYECDIYGFDADLHESDNIDNFGVSRRFVTKSGIKFIQSDISELKFNDNYFDRVFCISVMEHIDDFETRAKGMREIARILKPGGLALLTVDVNIMSRFTNPMELVWESGLNFYKGVDLSLPIKRFGIFCDGKQPADVFGMVLEKPSYSFETNYGDDKSTTPAHLSSVLRYTYPHETSDIGHLIRHDLKNTKSRIKNKFLRILKVILNILLKKYPEI